MRLSAPSPDGPVLTTDAGPPKTWWTTENRVGVGCLTVFALFALMIVIGTLVGGGDEDERTPQLDRVAAKLACQDFVRDRLKAPSTAQFTDTATTSEPGMDRFTVSGAVDAQNSFAAMIRNTYECEVALSTDGQRWSLVRLNGLGG